MLAAFVSLFYDRLDIFGSKNLRAYLHHARWLCFSATASPPTTFYVFTGNIDRRELGCWCGYVHRSVSPTLAAEAFALPSPLTHSSENEFHDVRMRSVGVFCRFRIWCLCLVLHWFRLLYIIIWLLQRLAHGYTLCLIVRIAKALRVPG